MTEETKTVAEPKQTAVINEKGIVEKASKGEELTPQEREVLKGIPPKQTASEEPIEVEEVEEKEDLSLEDDEKATPEEIKDMGEQAKEEVERVEKKEVSTDRRALIEAELNKPDNLVDLSKFNSPIELGLYWDLRKARSKNNRLQEENETLRIEKIVKEIQSKPKEETKKVDPFEGRDDEDILTVADVKKILAGREETKQAPPPLRTIDQLRVEKVEAESRLRSKGITDFYDVVDFAEQVLGKDQEAITILQDTAKSGGNVAEKTYWLIKGHPAWSEVEKVITDENRRKITSKPIPKENTERAERIEKNEAKVKTTGAGSGSSAVAKEFTVAEIANMTAADIRKMPKETRQAILKKFGSAPNSQI
jgi:hypothetical protein